MLDRWARTSSRPGRCVRVSIANGTGQPGYAAATVGIVMMLALVAHSCLMWCSPETPSVLKCVSLTGSEFRHTHIQSAILDSRRDAITSARG